MSALHSGAFQPPSGPDPTLLDIIRNLRCANEVVKRAVGFGRHPFGAILVGPDHQSILASQGNVSTVDHAESVLARIASTNFPPAYLWECSLYTTCEPCAMCSGTVYWANIGRVVFGLSESRLLELTGDHPENATMSVGARYIFEHGQKPIRVFGPVPEIEQELLEPHRSFWTARPR